MRAIGLVILIAAASCGVPASSEQPSPSGIVSFPSNFSMPLTQAVKRYRNSVVYLEAQFTDKTTGAIMEAHGTGFNLTTDGYVLTAGHLFNAMDGTAKVSGRTGSRHSPNSEELEILNISNNPDVALLKFRNTAVSRPPIPLGNPANLEDGAVLYVMGFPGREEWFQDQGSLSGKGGPQGSWSTTISFDPGISGAPVLNDLGQVVAIAWGGAPDTVGTLNRVLPINLLATQISSAGIPLNTDPPLSSITPLEQIAKRRRDGLLLRDGAPAFPMFSDGTSSVLVSSQGSDVLITVRAPEALHAALHVLPDQERLTREGEERSYSVSSGDTPCVRRETYPPSPSACGTADTAATVSVLREVTPHGPFTTASWRIPMSELGSSRRTASIALRGSAGFITTDGYHRLIW